MINSNSISTNINENRTIISDLLPLQDSFDLVQRDFQIGEKDSSYYFTDGMLNDEAMIKIMDSFLTIKAEEMPLNPIDFVKSHIPYTEVDIIYDFDTLVKKILSGILILIIDTYDCAIAIDCRTYPVRSVEEPEKDKSLRGSKDGFVETLVFDTALIRRRIRDPHLIMEMLEAGTSSKTDIVLCYMNNLADENLVNNLRSKINQLQVADLCMNQQSLAEAIIGSRWYNPFPKFKFTERPDTTAACIMEGKIAILVDNSPAALILPTSIVDMIEEANDYYFPGWTSLYLKFTRVLILLLTVFLTPIFLLFMKNPDWIPGPFLFIAVSDNVHIPLIYQLLILELAIDGLRLAALNTPNMLSTPLSIFSGLVLGEFSVESGWFNSEVMLYMAFVAIANYTQPNFELGYALKFMRMMLLILTAIFDWIGFLSGLCILLILLFFNRTLSGRNYMNIKQN